MSILSPMTYHERELALGLGAPERRVTMPLILPRHKRILDVGCGMGQTLIALNLAPDVEAYGVDPDLHAIVAGKRIAPSNIRLFCAGGEKLPFPDNHFDFVFSRVSVPYMDLAKAFREISRVLRPGGDLWLALHPASKITARLKLSARRARLKDIAVCSYVLLNGVIYHWSGTQLAICGRRETFQTIGGTLRTMRRAGLECTSLQWLPHFIVQGRKAAEER